MQIRIILINFLLVTASSGCSMWRKDSEPLPPPQAHFQEDNPNQESIRRTSYEESEDSKKLSLDDFTPNQLAEGFKKSIGQGPDEQKAQKEYDEGVALYSQAASVSGEKRRETFKQAAKRFSAAAKRWPDSRLEEDALYKLGESWFFADHYNDSRNTFDELIKKNPNTRYIDIVNARRFSIAEYWLGLHKADPRWILSPNFSDEKLPGTDTFGNALKLFDQIRLEDPTGDLADDATMAAGNAEFLAGRYLKADQYYTDLRKYYPSSEHQFQAHLLGIKCKQKTYRGPEYSGQPIDDAEQLIKKIRRQFPREALAQEKYLDQAYKEVRFQQALREWEMAQFYDQRKLYGGARFYYARVVRKYPHTSFATKARERMAQISNEPDKPPVRLAWLARMFEDIPEEEPEELELTPQPNSNPSWWKTMLSWRRRGEQQTQVR